MNKVSILILILVCIALIVSFFIYLHCSNGVDKSEIYENDEGYLIIEYQNSKSILFIFESKDKRKTISSAANFVNENTAVFDGKKALPEVSCYYEFVFHDNYIEFYNNGDFISKYTKTP